MLALSCRALHAHFHFPWPWPPPPLQLDMEVLPLSTCQAEWGSVNWGQQVANDFNTNTMMCAGSEPCPAGHLL